MITSHEQKSALTGHHEQSICEGERSAQPFVSVIVPVRNEGPDLLGILSSILAQDYPKDLIEILVVDGASQDGSAEIVRKFALDHPQVVYLNNPKGIVASALNAGIQHARGPVIVRMDAHTEYASDYVRQCVALLHQTGADNVGGPWVARGTSPFSRAVAAAFQSPLGSGGARTHDPAYEGWVDTVYLGCWHKELFDRLGLFSEELIRNQDDEHNLRLIRSGGKIWQSPRVQSWYRPRNCIKELFGQYCQYGYWKVRVIQRHRRPASLRHLIPGSSLLLSVLLAAIAPWSPLALWTLICLVSLHFTLTLIASLYAASKAGWRLLPSLPLVFYCFHLAYGYGSLRGLLDFVLSGRGPQPSFERLTRGSQRGSVTEPFGVQTMDRTGGGRPS